VRSWSPLLVSTFLIALGSQAPAQSPAQPHQATAQVHISVQQYLHITFDGCSSSTGMFSGSFSGPKTVTWSGNYTARGNLAFKVTSQLLRYPVGVGTWTCDIDNLATGNQTTMNRPAGITQRTAKVTLTLTKNQSWHGYGYLVLSIAPQ
jgi:hypothetical protein